MKFAYEYPIQRGPEQIERDKWCALYPVRNELRACSAESGFVDAAPTQCNFANPPR